MKTKREKTAEVAELKQVLEENPVIVVCSFQGIKVDQDFQLRRKIRESGAAYRVVSNRLAKLAAEGTPAAKTFDQFRGMTSLAYAKDDPVALLKVLLDYSKDNPVFSFRAGVVEGQGLDAAELDQLSKMPGKQEIQAKLLFVLNAPAQNLLRQVNAPAQHILGVLNAPARDLLSVLKQAVDQGKFGA